MDDDTEGPLPPFDPLDPDVVAARDAVGRAVSAYIGLIRSDQQPYVVAWTVGIEWTSPELERTNRAGRDSISPTDQTISATAGLGLYLSSRYA